MNIRDYWQQGAEAYQAFKHHERMAKLDADLTAIMATPSSYSCKCQRYDAHHCYAEKHDTMDIDDDKFCRCHCHKTDEF